ncbi:MAG: carbon storage regulator CsrA [Tissierellia bacterium]|nr:carbon storage regulator CsrA [Tissierellia bacterium]
MLILTRKKGQSIIINGNIEVKILEIGEEKVSIGIEAPKDIDIFRKELYESIEEENIRAANVEFDVEEMKKIIKKKH